MSEKLIDKLDRLKYWLEDKSHKFRVKHKISIHRGEFKK